MLPRLVVVVSFACAVLSGCQTTMRWSVRAEAPQDPREKIPSWLEVERHYKPWRSYKTEANHFTFRNTSDQVAYLVFKDSVIEIDGTSKRVLPGSHLLAHADTAAPDHPIAPHGSTYLELFPADVALPDKAKKRENALKSAESEIQSHGLVFRLAVRREQDPKPEFMVLYVDGKAPRGEALGEIVTEQKSICAAPTNPESEKVKNALAAAREKFGDKVATVEFVGCAFD